MRSAHRRADGAIVAYVRRARVRRLARSLVYLHDDPYTLV